MHRFKIVFRIGCFFNAIYFTTLFSTQFYENTDAQLIVMKKFNQEKDSDYPAFSICFKGTSFHWYHDLEIFNSNGLDALQYELLLKGETAIRYERNDLNRTYNRTPVFVDGSGYFNFSNYHLKMHDFIRSIHYYAKSSITGSEIAYATDWNEAENQQLYLSYHTPETICFSRKSTDNLTSIRLNDLITFNSSAISDTRFGDVQMDIFLHYPNQLIQSFGNAKYSTTLSQLVSTLDYTYPKVLEIKISQCKRIKKRVDSNEPCNEAIHNYDQYFQKNVATHLGCVPIYFKQAMNNDSDLKECSTKIKLKEAQYIIDNYDKFLSQFKKPCDEMLVLTSDSVDHNPIPKPSDIAINFVYAEKVYEEIQYTKAIEFVSWLSNVGGFVGIFMGHSMMQVPELLLVFTSIFSYERRNRFRGKFYNC